MGEYKIMSSLYIHLDFRYIYLFVSLRLVMQYPDTMHMNTCLMSDD